MKISVSNIAWDNSLLEEHLSLLKELSCQGVEIAPSCIWKEPAEVSSSEIREFKKIVAKYGLEIPAFHALLFTRPDLRLFDDSAVRGKTISYLKHLIRLAGDLSVKVLVFGSAKNRMVGKRPYEACYRIAVDAFSELAAEASRHNTCFCIEPLGRGYTDFINSAEEGYRLTEAIGSPHFGLHLDVRAMAESGENFEAVFNTYGDKIKHFHIGGPDLSPPCSGSIDHSRVGRYLAKSPYKGFVSIEMRKGLGDTKETVRKAVLYVKEKYRIN